MPKNSVFESLSLDDSNSVNNQSRRLPVRDLARDARQNRTIQAKAIRYVDDLFGADLPPAMFDPDASMDDFETFADAKARRNRMSRLLRTGDQAAQALSKKLADCWTDSRCLSAVCHVCMRRMRRNWAAIIAREVAADDSDWVAVSAVPVRRYALGSLNQFQPKAMKNNLRKQVSRSELADTTILGGIDFNFQVQRRGCSYWSPHWYLLIKASSELVRNALGKHYPAGSLTPRPLQIRALEKGQVLAAATYSLKPTFYQKSPEANCTVRRLVEIDSVHWLELAPLLDSWGVIQRLFQRYIW